MNLKKIILEEINDFDWTSSIPTAITYVGQKFIIDKNSTGASSDFKTDNAYIILEITSFNKDNISYIIIGTTRMQQPIGYEGTTNYDNVRDLINSGYWQPYNDTLKEESNDFE